MYLAHSTVGKGNLVLRYFDKFEWRHCVLSVGTQHRVLPQHQRGEMKIWIWENISFHRVGIEPTTSRVYTLCVPAPAHVVIHPYLWSHIHRCDLLSTHTISRLHVCPLVYTFVPISTHVIRHPHMWSHIYTSYFTSTHVIWHLHTGPHTHTSTNSVTQHAMPPKFGRKWRREYFITRFPLSTMLCARYSVKLKILLNKRKYK